MYNYSIDVIGFLLNSGADQLQFREKLANYGTCGLVGEIKKENTL